MGDFKPITIEEIVIFMINEYIIAWKLEQAFILLVMFVIP